MKVICKIPDAVCPEGRRICCGTCEDADTCCEVCPSALTNIHLECPEAEQVTDEVATFQSAVPDTTSKITELITLKKQLDEQEKQLKQKLVEAMEFYGVKSFENDMIKMTYVAPTTRSSIDSTRLKKDHPDIAAEYSKVSDVAASVRVTLKGGGK